MTPEREFFNFKENMMKEINKIAHDERTYIESIGKQDKDTVREALADRGQDTILRMCFGLSGQPMPIRALGYFASALAVHELYFRRQSYNLSIRTELLIWQTTSI